MVTACLDKFVRVYELQVELSSSVFAKWFGDIVCLGWCWAFVQQGWVGAQECIFISTVDNYRMAGLGVTPYRHCAEVHGANLMNVRL